MQKNAENVYLCSQPSEKRATLDRADPRLLSRPVVVRIVVGTAT
jgi:hypothetical protein